MSVKKTTKKAITKSVQESINRAYQAELDEIGVDNAVDIDVPLHLRGGEFHWNFEKKTPLVDKILWVLAVVEVAILISLIVKNAY